MDAGRRENRGQAIQELQGGEAQGGAAGGVWLRQDIEDLVGTAVHQMEAFEGKGRPRTVADQSFEPLTVGGLDMNASIQTEPSAVLPSEHVLCVVGLQEAVADHVAEDPFPDCVLEALQELVGEGSGFVEAEAGFRMRRILNRVILDSLEESIHDDEMKVKMRIEA
jgi:hypothetical protein